MPGDTREAVLASAKLLAGPGVEVTALGHGSDPSKVAPTDSASYRLINRTIREVFPGAIVAPGRMIAATDSRYYDALCDSVYRFSPIRAKVADLARFHGTNERISESNYAEVIRFHRRLIEQSSAPVAPPAR